jgi:hypothetical protein
MRCRLACLDTVFQSETRPALVDRLNQPFAIQHDDFGGDGIEDDALEGLVFLQGIFSLLALGDVRDVADDLDDPIPAANRLGARSNPLRGLQGLLLKGTSKS